MDGEPELTAALRALLRQRRESMEPPTDEELLAYWEGTLSPEQRTEMEARIAAFPEAAELLRDLNRFGELETLPDVDPLSDEEVANRWEAFREGLEREGEWEEEGDEGDEPAPAPITPLPGRGGRSPRHRRRGWQGGLPPWLTVAAVLVAVVLGWIAGSVFQQPAPPRLAVPDTGGRVLALAPVEGDVLRGAPEVETVEAGQPLAVLLPLPAEAQAPFYRIGLRGPEGLKWSEEATPSPFGELHVFLPRDWVVPGLYHLTVHTADGSQVADYRFQVE